MWQILTVQSYIKGTTLKASSNFPNRTKKKPAKTTSKGEIRLIGGQWRGRRLKVHDKEGLRPTTDRLKETLFNWLMTDVRNAKVLDCFAGAGSLGFEAASRGAESVMCFEKNKQAAQQLKDNCQLLNASQQITVKQGDFFQQIKHLDGEFDLVFIDPPFHRDFVEPTIKLLLEGNKLRPGSLVYIEQEQGTGFDLAQSDWQNQFALTKNKDAGQVKAQLFEFIG